MGLADYKDLVAAAASITTIAQFFSGVFICKDIVKKGNTENISAIPFLGGAGMFSCLLHLEEKQSLTYGSTFDGQAVILRFYSLVIFVSVDLWSRVQTIEFLSEKIFKNVSSLGWGVLMLQYSEMLDDPAMTRVNIVGFTLNLLYLVCYYIYSQEKKELQIQIFYTTAFVGVLLAYVYWEATEVVEFRFGIILTALMMLLIGSPLLSLGEILRTKSTETLPFPLIISATVVTFLWLLYGIIIENEFIQFQNAVGFILSVVQLSLFAIYPSKPQIKEKKEK